MQFETFYMQIVCLGLLVLVAHYCSKLTHRIKMGEVIGQVLGGLIVGPVIIFFIGHKFPAYQNALMSLHFFTFVFLSLIAFGIGDELNFSKLKKTGKEVVIISLIQAFVTWGLLTATFLVAGFEPIYAFIIGSIGVATAPAATFVIMNKLGITGSLRNLLGGVVVLDDVLEIIVFSIATQIALTLMKGQNASMMGVILPVIEELLFALLLGVAIFILIRLAINRKWLNTKGQAGQRMLGPEFLSRLISELPGPSMEVFLVVAGVVSLGIGLALHWRLPFLITAVFGGFLISNLHSRDIFKSLNIQNATSIYSLVFFALIGANVELEFFHPENYILVGAYVIARALGKIFGTWLGCKITKQSKRIAKVLPRLMLPQAGVAAIEAFFVATVFGVPGEKILSIVLPGLIIFEVIGVIISERTLLKWRSWVTGGGDFLEDEEEYIRTKIQQDSLKLSGLLAPDSVIVPFRVTSKGEATWELLQVLHNNGYIQEPGQVLEIILERERQGGITLGEGVAILHGRIPGLENPVIALGIMPQEPAVIFSGEAEQPVRIVYLVLSPEDKPGMHLQVLACIAKLLGKKEVRQKLLDASNEIEVLKIIRENSPQ
ncbi:PTS sugar transporter subunit IIA [bacterium]|nr:PTS sugar transporter subunit IIA [bacterium]